MTEELKKTEARQGVTGHNVRWVLRASMLLAVLALIVVYFGFFNT
tara:strand:- start:85 stop:219 length:135 start_codon:yes stop_codon:yes gene_type:complete